MQILGRGMAKNYFKKWVKKDKAEDNHKHENPAKNDKFLNFHIKKNRKRA